MNQVRETFFLTTGQSLNLLKELPVRVHWEADSSLPGMTVGALAAHLTRSVWLVQQFLAKPEPEDPASTGPLVSAEGFYAAMSWSEDPENVINSRITERAARDAEAGWATVIDQAEEQLAELRATLAAAPETRFVPLPNWETGHMLLDDYLRTRLVEFSVHHEDLAGSVSGVNEKFVLAHPEGVRLATEVLLGAARERSGDVAVLRALSRRERDLGEVLRVL